MIRVNNFYLNDEVSFSSTMISYLMIQIQILQWYHYRVSVGSSISAVLSGCRTLNLGQFERTSVEREVIIYNEDLIDLEIEEVIITGSDYYTTTFSDATIDPGGIMMCQHYFCSIDQVVTKRPLPHLLLIGTQTIELTIATMDQSGVGTISPDEAGDGTEVNPFATIQKGVDMSGSKDTV